MRHLIALAALCLSVPASACDLRHLPWESYAADVAIVGDSATTAYLVHRPGFHEANPLLGRHPSNAIISAVGLGRIALTTGTVCYLQDRDPKMAKFFSIFSLAINGGAFGANLRFVF